MNDQGHLAGAAGLGRVLSGLYLSIWLAAFGLAGWAGMRGVIAASEIFAGPKHYPLTYGQWLTLVVWAAVPVTCLIVSIALVTMLRRQSLAALASLTLLLLASTQVPAGNFWASLGAGEGGSSALLAYLVLENLAWFGLMLTFAIFPSGKFVSSWMKWVVVGSGMLQLLIACGQYAVQDEAVSSLSSLTRTIFFLLGVVALFEHLQQAASRRERLQAQWALAGAVILTLASIVWFCLTLLPPWLDLPRSSIAGRVGGLVLPTGLIGLALALLVAFRRPQLYDASAALTRSLAFAILTTTASMIFLAGEKALSLAVAGSVENDTVRGLVVATLALVLVTPLKDAVAGWATRRLRKPLMNLRDELPRCLNELRGFASIKQLLEEAAYWIEAAVRPRYLVAILDGEVELARGIEADAVRSWLEGADLGAAGSSDQGRDDGLFPVRLPLRVNSGTIGTPLGWLLIGRRSDESAYGKDELSALRSAATPLARAIQAVQQRQA